MCTNPLYIRNKRYKSLYCKISTSFVKVPCGVCDECLRKRANDLFVRAFYEYDYCLKSGGIGFMCTLTYSNDNLPYLDVNGKKFMVFNKKHIIDFIKRLRINLERYYKKHYNSSAPFFKYLVTSEYGTDPTRSHRPHYHLLFFFKDMIYYNTFRNLFVLSQSVNGINVFGKIYQCDPLDPKKGGIKYSAKYVCKDIMFDNQRKVILEKIKFYRDYVNNLYCIDSLPENDEQEFRNKCIRTSKEYKYSISKFVLPYRHMLQFYMLSNDLGVSAALDKYGTNIFSLLHFNVSGFPFTIPKLVKTRIEKNYGYKKSNELAKSIFLEYFKKCCNTLIDEKNLSVNEFQDLYLFAQTYIIPLSGCLYLYNPLGLDLYTNLVNQIPLKNWDSILNEFRFFDENDFFTMRNRILEIMDIYDSEDRKTFRARIARTRSRQEKENYEKKKRNNSINY